MNYVELAIILAITLPSVGLVAYIEGKLAAHRASEATRYSNRERRYNAGRSYESLGDSPLT